MNSPHNYPGNVVLVAFCQTFLLPSRVVGSPSAGHAKAVPSVDMPGTSARVAAHEATRSREGRSGGRIFKRKEVGWIKVEKR